MFVNHEDKISRRNQNVRIWESRLQCDGSEVRERAAEGVPSHRDRELRVRYELVLYDFNDFVCY